MATLPRVMLAAPASGGGKTTITCGLLQVLARRGLTCAALKSGPDYLDPTFHRKMTGAHSGNLDLFFCDETRVRELVARDAEDCDFAVLEGVMGFYDGILGQDVRASSYDVARATGTPVILVLNARGASISLAAQVKGFKEFRPNSHVRGFILNKCSKMVYDVIAPLIAEECGVVPIGYVPSDERFLLESRHLGLVDADEVTDLPRRVEALADTLEETLDVEALLALASEADEIAERPFRPDPVAVGGAPRIAVARDLAFSFYYSENLRTLEDLGAELAWFSPISDEGLPEGADALYLGGGYPEMHASELSQNQPMCAAVRGALDAGMPCIAECGGFMYLQHSLRDVDGVVWPMVGVLPGDAENVGRLRHFGYIDLEAAEGGLLGEAGARLRAHEYHYWHSEDEGEAFVASKPGRARSWKAAYHTGSLYAGYPHMYWPGDPEPARRFVSAACAWRDRGRRP